jgi:hypothetical protein
LACICRSEEGSSVDCCIGDNAQIPTVGALDENRTVTQKNYLTSVCNLTDATIENRCPSSTKALSQVLRSSTKPSCNVINGALDPVVPIRSSGGFSDGAMSGMIATAASVALLSLCC